jgi:Zn-dependent M28 family amino/carboxypeptidase
MRTLRHLVAAGAVVLAAACPGPRAAPPRSAAPPSPTTSPSSPAPAGPARVTVAAILRHLEALQAIADEHAGNRSVGTPGYQASVDYVVGTLREAGYAIATPSTDVPVFEQLGRTLLERSSPSPRSWVDGRDVRAMLFSAAGDVEGTLASPGGTGCSPADFAGFATDTVALLGPGPCFRRQQVVNAQTAGAVAVIAVTTAARGRPVRPTLIAPDGIEVPAVAVTAAAGDELAGGDVVRVAVRGRTTVQPVASVVAEPPAAEDGPVVMFGGHLDSVMDGPGINDNGSGVALLLELARWIAAEDPTAPVRFAFWGGEEVGLYGSRAYVAGLDGDELGDLRVYVNLDMVASPNFVTYVYRAAPGDPPEAHRVAEVLERALSRRGFESEPLDLGGASDHAPFQDAGIATGGLYSGSSERKTPAQSEAYGGGAGLALDPCYHQPCDAIDNVSREALRRHAVAVAALLSALLA